MSTSKPTPQVGQTLYSLNVGNAARYREQKLTPIIVRKVGRKYFECSTETIPTYLTTYRLDDWREKTEYNVNSQLYKTEQEWLDEQETSIITTQVRKLFDPWTGTHLPLEKLRRIKEIIES